MSLLGTYHSRFHLNQATHWHLNLLSVTPSTSHPLSSCGGQAATHVTEAHEPTISVLQCDQ